jgi:hypothetical protein
MIGGTMQAAGMATHGSRPADRQPIDGVLGGRLHSSTAERGAGPAPVSDAEHAVAIGAGWVGTRAIDDLCGLGALVTVVERQRAPENDPAIMRAHEPRFAAAIRSQFQIRRAFSATELASAAFSELVALSAARGRVAVCGAVVAPRRTDRHQRRSQRLGDRPGLSERA